MHRARDTWLQVLEGPSLSSAHAGFSQPLFCFFSLVFSLSLLLLFRTSRTQDRHTSLALWLVGVFVAHAYATASSATAAHTSRVRPLLGPPVAWALLYALSALVRSLKSPERVAGGLCRLLNACSALNWPCPLNKGNYIYLIYVLIYAILLYSTLLHHTTLLCTTT